MNPALLVRCVCRLSVVVWVTEVELLDHGFCLRGITVSI